MKNKRFILSISLACGIFAFILIFDLLSKHFIIQKLVLPGQSIDVIPGFFNFVYVQNTGAAWGVLAGRPVFLIIFSIIILAIYLYFYAIRLKKLRNKTSIILSISVGLIAGGCIGNLVDRIFLGYVRDFINLQFMDFPVFNIADIAITIGVIIMFVYFIFVYPKEDKKDDATLKQIESLKDMSEIEKLNKEIAEIDTYDKPKDNNDNSTKNAENLQEKKMKTDKKVQPTDNLKSGDKDEG